MISIQHLQKSFGDNTVLKHIDLSVEKGRLLLLSGHRDLVKRHSCVVSTC